MRGAEATPLHRFSIWLSRFLPRRGKNRFNQLENGCKLMRIDFSPWNPFPRVCVLPSGRLKRCAAGRSAELRVPGSGRASRGWEAPFQASQPDAIAF
jgi:hypothetical protein